MKRMLRLWGPPLILLSAALLLFFSGLLDEHPVFANFDSKNMRFENKRREAALEKGDAYGVVASEGPHFNLDPGEYRLKWSVYADGENAFRLSFANGARIEPAELIMPEGVEDGEFVFSVLEPGVDLSVKADFQEGTHLTLLFLRLYLPAQKDRAWTFLALCAALSALWIMRETGRLKRKDAAAWVLLAGMLFIACAPALRGSAGVWENQNGMKEMVQADQIAQAIRSGHPGAPFHHGYPDERETALSIARPDVFLLPWALMRLSGASAAYTLNCWMMTIHILCAAAAYAAAKACGLRREEAVLCAVLVTAAPWRISAVYIQGTFRELASLAMICLCLWSIAEKRYGRTAFCAAAFLASPAFGRNALDRSGYLGNSRIHWEEKSVQLLVCAEGCAALRISVDTDAVCGSRRMAVPGLDGSRSHGFDVCGSGDRCGGAGQASGAGKKCNDRRNHRHAAAYPDAGAA